MMFLYFLDVCSREDVSHVIHEALVMAEFHHPNVLGLLGISISGSTELSTFPLLVLPYMANGDIHKFLRSFRYGERHMGEVLLKNYGLIIGLLHTWDDVTIALFLPGSQQ